MKGTPPALRRAWDELLHGDTFGPATARRLLPMAGLGLLVWVLDATDIISWRITLGALVVGGVIYLAVRHRRGSPTASSSQPVATVQTVVTTTHVPASAPSHKPASEHDNGPDTIEMVAIETPGSNSTDAADEVRYNENFMALWLAERLVLPFLAWVLVLLGLFFSSRLPAEFQQYGVWIWLAFAVSSIVLVLYAYYQWLAWRGSRFVATFRSYSLPRDMPLPFESKTPTIRSSDVAYTVRETLVDKLFHTCRISADTPSKGDEEFGNIRWLKYPDKVRYAVGSAPRRHVSWTPWKRSKRVT